ncbi:MAG: DoxX family protein [Bacteroidales bacterium]|nr:DoxX family protein [Bacteroidales bacterium]
MKKNILLSFVPHTAFLILRIGIGIMFMFHGMPKLFAGAQTWEFLGSQMSVIGISFAPVFWGFMAALSETLGGLLLILGLFTRPAALLMLFTMFIAALMHFTNGDGLKGASHAIEMAIVFSTVLIAGSGKLSLDHLFFASRKK